MARKPKKHEHVNHERWLVSYADFITLLFAFFVVMFAVSQVDSKKLGRLVESVNHAFQIKGVFPEGQGSPLMRGGSAGNSIVPQVVPARPTILPYRVPPPGVKAVHDALATEFEDARVSSEVSLRYDPRGIVVSIPQNVLFEAGSAKLIPAAIDQLGAIARSLARREGQVQVEVHTDDLEAPTADFTSNWHLSATRSAYVADFLIEEAGFQPERLSVTGLAQYRPLVDGDALDRNRRVDLLLVVEG